jgi:hypothetical protein
MHPVIYLVVGFILFNMLVVRRIDEIDVLMVAKKVFIYLIRIVKEMVLVIIFNP